ncbi:MAG TPA: 4-hydroxy-tetrahydrodipicolinate reductase [Candidatus Paceibacterota bacterium]
MNISLLGHGNMGQEVEALLQASGRHTTSVVKLSEPGGEFDLQEIASADVVVDFTSPEIVLKNIEKVTGAGKNMVVGTSGWYDKLPQVNDLAKKNNVGLIYGQNFSIGANIFFALIREASRLTYATGAYDVFGYEIHHSGKKDSPSGTALRTAKEILENFKSKTTLVTDKLDRKINPEELHLASVRGGINPGHHEVTFDGPADAIKISHSAHSRRGFAEGAIFAAEFITGKKGIYTFDDAIKTLITK